MAGAYLGVALHAVDEARDHLKRRAYKHSGSSLGDEPILQHRFGRLWSRVEQTRRFAFWAAQEYDHAGPDALPAILSSKAEVADCVVEVVNEILTLTGGIGYGEGSTLHRLLRDARAAHVMSPTTDFLRLWTGRVLLDQPILGR
jgi:alkylation response protein AidB-like acyl-CoA dehydrogenase